MIPRSNLCLSGGVGHGVALGVHTLSPEGSSVVTRSGTAEAGQLPRFARAPSIKTGQGVIARPIQLRSTHNQGGAHAKARRSRGFDSHPRWDGKRTHRPPSSAPRWCRDRNHPLTRVGVDGGNDSPGNRSFQSCWIPTQPDAKRSCAVPTHLSALLSSKRRSFVRRNFHCHIIAAKQLATATWQWRARQSRKGR